MIKVFCDWCKVEAVGDSMGGAFGRRVALTADDNPCKLDVIFQVEFVSDDRPEHVCIPCFHKVVSKAVNKLLADHWKNLGV